MPGSYLVWRNQAATLNVVCFAPVCQYPENGYTQNMRDYPHFIPKYCVFLWITGANRKTRAENRFAAPRSLDFRSVGAPLIGGAGARELRERGRRPARRNRENRPATPRICAHFPSEIFSNLSKNPVNLSKFILFFGIVQG